MEALERTNTANAGVQGQRIANGIGVVRAPDNNKPDNRDRKGETELCRRVHHAHSTSCNRNTVNMYVCGPRRVDMSYPTYRNADVAVGARSVSHTGTQAKLDGTNGRSRKVQG